MSKRRHHGSIGDTPGKTAPKKSDSIRKPERTIDKGNEKPARRSLFSTKGSDCVGRCAEWSREETAALVEYVALYWEGAHTNGWPSHKNENFWAACAKAIVDATGLSKRTGRLFFIILLIFNSSFLNPKQAIIFLAI